MGKITIKQVAKKAGMSIATVSRVLNNRKYIGQVEHKGQVYPGEHEAVVPQRLWDEAHRILAQNCRSRARRCWWYPRRHLW